MGSFDVLLGNERTQLDVFVEEYRSALEVTLNGVTVQQARTRLVPSSTTLLGLLKHVTWMQRVWFEECVDGTSRQGAGPGFEPGPVLPARRGRHRRLRHGDLPAGLRDGSRGSRRTVARRRRDRPPDRAAHTALGVLQVLRELAHHCGHADILREQVLADLRDETSPSAPDSPADREH